jgi:peptidoglycan/LPS O-acetylase OafA/YrhL
MVPFEFYRIDRSFRLVPPTWSIAVELINYFILWAVVARSALMTGLAFVGALAYHIVSLKFGQDWSARFLPSYAALLPFAAGAAIYFVRKSVHWVPSSIPLLAASGLGWLVNLLICGALGGTSGSYFDGFFYANVVAVTIFIFLSASLSFDSLKAFDKAVGDLAYPVFLVHWLVGYFIASTLLPGQRRGLELLAYSLPVILLVSMGLAWIARQCLEPARDRIRNRLSASSDGKA